MKSIEIPTVADYVLCRARIPSCLVADPPASAVPDGDQALLLDLRIVNGTVEAITPSDPSTREEAGPVVDLGGRHVWPTLVDVHTHLDKGHVIDRAQNPGGDFIGARDAITEDRIRHWHAEDVYRRMEFGLRCAEAHGVAAIRTHLDSHEPQGDISWPVFKALRAAWRDRVALQAVSLMPVDMYQGPYGDDLADVVAEAGGILGGVTRASGGSHGGGPDELDVMLDRLFTLAAARNLDIDLHVDETGDPAAASLWNIAQAALRHDYQGRVTCGHCCSLAVQDDRHVARTIESLVAARITIITLPTVNMYLQDRVPDRTPRWRGVTLVKELRSAGVRVAIAGDNCRDPFYAYGDHDMLDTFRQGVQILHLDHPYGDAPSLVTHVPAEIMGLSRGMIRTGGAADMIILNARAMNQVIARPQSDRIIVKAGRRQDLALPDYSELDFVAEARSRLPHTPGVAAAE